MYHYVLGLLKRSSSSGEHCCWEQGLWGKVQMCGIAFWIVLGGLFRRWWHFHIEEKPLRLPYVRQTWARSQVVSVLHLCCVTVLVTAIRNASSAFFSSGWGYQGLSCQEYRMCQSILLVYSVLVTISPAPFLMSSSPISLLNISQPHYKQPNWDLLSSVTLGTL